MWWHMYGLVFDNIELFPTLRVPIFRLFKQNRVKTEFFEIFEDHIVTLCENSTSAKGEDFRNGPIRIRPMKHAGQGCIIGTTLAEMVLRQLDARLQDFEI